MKAKHVLAIAAALAGTALVSRPAAAQHRVDTVEYTGPDRGLLKTGVWTLGLSYVPALVVGISSDRPEDRYLLAPVAGPWIDFAKRDCPAGNGCNHETLYKALLATDGVIQGIGALEILGSFFFTEHSVASRSARAVDRPQSAFELHVVPKKYTGGYGLAAVGKF